MTIVTARTNKQIARDRLRAERRAAMVRVDPIAAAAPLNPDSFAKAVSFALDQHATPLTAAERRLVTNEMTLAIESIAWRIAEFRSSFKESK